MKALTLWQPWASLIAVGAKTIETRSWSTKYRGPLAIHASKHYEPFRIDEDHGWVSGSQMLWDRDGDLSSHSYFHPVPLGAVVATAQLIDCVPTDPDTMSDFDRLGGGGSVTDPGCYVVGGETWLADYGLRTWDLRVNWPLGDFGWERWLWLLADIQPLDPPVPTRGRQRLWEWMP